VVVPIRPVRSRGDRPALDDKRTDNIFRWHVALRCGSTLINNKKVLVLTRFRSGEQVIVPRCILSNKTVEKINEYRVSAEILWNKFAAITY